MNLSEIQSKTIELAGKIESAEMRLSDARQVLVSAHLNDGDASRANADVIAAKVDLDALRQAHSTVLDRIPAAEQAALDDLLNKRRNKIGRLSKTYRAKLGKSEDFLRMFLTELAAANRTLEEISQLTVLPDIGELPPEWKALQQALSDPKSPMAIAAATIIATEDRIFAERLGSALCNHKTSAMQCNGRTMLEMAISPEDHLA